MQSTALVAMAGIGDLGPVDLVVFVDAGFERRATYRTIDWYTAWLRDHGVQVERVDAGDIRVRGLVPSVHLPLYCEGGGRLGRQCTIRFRVWPFRRRIREKLGYPGCGFPHPSAGAVEQWLGISLEEKKRARKSGVASFVSKFPLLELGWSRDDCIAYLEDHGLPVPVRSACMCCPMRTAREWLEIKEEEPESWKEVVAFDEGLRDGSLDESGIWGNVFLYRKRVPLGEADLAADAARCR